MARRQIGSLKMSPKRGRVIAASCRRLAVKHNKRTVASNPVYLEIVDFFASGTTPQAVIDFQPSAAAQQRALELLEIAGDGQLTPEQESELEHFTELEHILRMAKVRARQILAAKQ